VSQYKAANNAVSLLAAPITNVALALTVSSGHGARFPEIVAGQYTRLTLQDELGNIEIVEVSAHTAGSDSFTLSARAREGTTARAWTAGALVELRPTAGVVATLDGAQTLQNKVINVSQNLIYNVGTAERLSLVTGVNALTGTALGVTAYIDGQRFSYVVPDTNTGAVTFSVNGLPALPVVKDRARALEAGDLRAGQRIHLDCDGGKFWVSYGCEGIDFNVAQLLSLKAPVDNPVFTGVVQVPAAVGNNSPVRLEQINAFLDVLRAERRGMIFVSQASSFTGALLLNGTLALKALYPDLWAWVQAKGLVVSEGAWPTRLGMFTDFDATRFRLPQVSGYVIRAHHNGATIDPDHATRLVGSIQGDAIRNITGTLVTAAYSGGYGSVSGVFSKGPVNNAWHSFGADGYGSQTATLDVSTQVPTAAENRMVNISMNYFIYH
jgi:hypothetical protein